MNETQAHLIQISLKFVPWRSIEFVNCVYMNETEVHLIQISLKFVPLCSIKNPGDKLPDPM